MKRLIQVFLSFVFLIGIVNATTLEERVKLLEKKVEQLEDEISQLKGQKNGQVKVPQRPIPIEEKNLTGNTVNMVAQLPKPVDFEVVDKKFHEAEREELLWNRDSKIIFVVKFKSLLDKPADVITGKFIVMNKEGKVLAIQPVKINKAFNFIRGTTIKPNEIIKMEVEIVYESNNEDLRYLRDAPISELKFKFEPIEVVFTDGTIIYYKKPTNQVIHK